MAVIGVTGGIASGKSRVMGVLASWLDASAFSADDCVARLYEEEETRRDLAGLFGDRVLDAEGKPKRDLIRSVVFRDNAMRIRLESLLHPRIRAEWTKRSRAFRQRADAHYLVEIPLLFETGAERELDATLTVGCSRSVQMERLRQTRGIDTATAGRILEAQLDVYRRMELADWVIWNDGSREGLDSQAAKAARKIQDSWK